MSLAAAAINDASYDVLDLSALSYAQTATYLGIPLDASAPFSIDAWLKLDGLCASASILSQDAAFSFGVAGQSLVLSIAGLPPVISNPSVQALDTLDWHHVAVTFASGQARIYIDGQFNVLQAISGNGQRGTQPFRIGDDLQAHVESLRVFNTALSGDVVKSVMFDPPPTGTVVVDFDFSVTPPLDRGAGRLPITLQQGAQMTRSTPALSLAGTAFAQPLSDQHVNPGGQQVDPYTVQSWVYVASSSPPQQAVFVNSDLQSETGMALYLDYDAAASAFRLVSQRGSNQDDDPLRSTAVVKTGIWTNVATTFDGATLAVYIDGQPAGSAPFGPIPLVSDGGRLMVGAALTAGQPFGTITLQGYISRLEVWSIALTPAQIQTYLTQSPDPDEVDGLEADYDFTTSRARNVLDAHPVGLADGADLTEQVQAATAGPATSPTARAARPLPSLEPAGEQLAHLLASRDPAAVPDGREDDLRAAMAADLAAYDGRPDEQEIVRAAWQQVLDAVGADGAPPFHLTSHIIDGHHVVVCHKPAGSYVALRVPVGALDDCTMWTVQLIFIVVAGLLDALFGLSVRLTDRAISFITGFLARPQIAVLLTQGTAMTAGGIFAICSSLYSYGVLSELVPMIVELGFWALIRVAAKFALKLIGIGAADLIASLVATAAAFILKYSQKPAACNALPSVELSGIKFDYDPTATATDALSIRRNYSTTVPITQWTKTMTKPEQSPAAYAISRVSGKTVTIQASFLITQGATSAEVKADGGGLLGAIDPFTVTFSGGASSPQYVTIPLAHHALASGGVQRQDVQWNWSYRLPSGSWLPMATTSHRIYVILSNPTLPWQQPPGGADHQRLWTDVLDYSCIWAAGATTEAAAAAAVTTKANASIGLSYETSMGKSAYTDTVGSDVVFLCTRFIDFLRTGIGLGPKVNCTDCASIVTTFANALGCSLMASTMLSMATINTGFACNKIQAIGYTTWAYPFGTSTGGGFSYHEVAWTALASYTDPLYDACLKADGGNNPWNWTDGTITHVPTLALAMQFTTVGLSPPLPIPTPFTALSYRERLCTNAADGIGSCFPRGPWPNTQNGHRRLQ